MLRKGHGATDRPLGAILGAWAPAGRRLWIRSEGGKLLMSHPYPHAEPAKWAGAFTARGVSGLGAFIWGLSVCLQGPRAPEAQTVSALRFGVFLWSVDGKVGRQRQLGGEAAGLGLGESEAAAWGAPGRDVPATHTPTPSQRSRLSWTWAVLEAGWLEGRHSEHQSQQSMQG